jgi:DNA-3-methyladenine glycosylase II
MSPGRLILCDADVAEGADWLAARCPRMARALAQTGPLPLRRRPDGFAALFHAIVSQQVSVASANAIWARVEDAGLTRPEAVREVGSERLCALGLSRQKVRYAQALADARIDYEVLRSLPDAAVIETLVEVPGIGAWTAEIYAMFSLGRADVFAPGDLALQEAARALYDLAARPTPAGLREMARDWSPWRSVAARLLFAYYRTVRQREGIA